VNVGDIALKDQVEAACREAAKRSEALEEIVSEGAGCDQRVADARIMQKWEAMLRRFSAEEAECCEHIADMGPQPLHAALWRPDRVLCVTCVGKGGFALPGEQDRTCDTCGTVTERGVRPILLTHGLWIVHAGVCNSCADSMEIIT